MTVTLRKFAEEDIPLKVKWINNSANNQYLHYDLPLREEPTRAWFNRVKDLDTRLDLTILCDDVPVGVIGLLDINRKKGSAEVYLTVGEVPSKGKGIATQAFKELLRIAFSELGLHRVMFFTETGNAPILRISQKLGFVKEGCLRDELKNRDGEYVSRYVFSMLEKEFEALYGNN